MYIYMYMYMKLSFSYLPDDNQRSNLDWLNAKRRTLVRNKCDVYMNNNTVGSLHSSVYMADDTHRAIYCYVPKVATSSMKYLLTNSTSNISIMMDLNIHNVRIMRSAGVMPMSDIKDAAERQYKLEHYKTIIVVRITFEQFLKMITLAKTTTHLNYLARYSTTDKYYLQTRFRNVRLWF